MGSRPRPMNAVIKDPQHFRRVADCIQDMNTRQDNTDLCFVCARGHRVFAHKLLLCAVSSHMKEMILENPDRHDLVTIHLPDVEARLLRLMLDFLYEGDLHVIKTDYAELQKLMTLLGVILKSRSDKTSQLASGGPSQPVQPQPSQLVYVQAPGPNNQGQMQYMIATPAMLSGQMMQVASTPTASLPQAQMMQMATSASLSQGQMMQVAAPTASHPQGQMMQVATPAASLPQGQIMQMAPNIMSQANGQMVMQVAQAEGSGQVMQVSAPTTSMPQGQIMQMSPAIMSQAGGQMVQGGLQEVTTPMQQNSVMQVVPQSSAQVPQPTQRPQYVMSSTSNQMTTSRAQAQYTQPQTTPQQRTVRSRTTNQLAQTARTSGANSETGNSIMEDILGILKENCENNETIETLTARHLREILEPKLGLDLANHEELIDQVLKSFLRGMEENVRNESEESEESASNTMNIVTRAKKPAPSKAKVTRRRRRRVILSDDDEDDEDFNPKQGIKRRPKRK